MKDFQTAFTIKDTIFDLKLTWSKDVKEQTQQHSCRKLYGHLMLLEEDEQENYDFEVFNVSKKTIEDIMEMMACLPTDDPKKKNEEDVTEWIDVDAQLLGKEELTDHDTDPAIPEKEGREEEQVSEEVKVLWKKAEHIDKLIHFVEQNNLYKGAEVINFHILWNDLYMKREQSRLWDRLILRTWWGTWAARQKNPWKMTQSQLPTL